MEIQEIINRINENSRYLAEGGISAIERDILLDDLRRLYLLAKGIVPVQQIIFEEPIGAIETRPAPPAKEEVKTPVIEQKPVETTEIVRPKEEPKLISAPPEKQVETEKDVKAKPSSLNEIFVGEERSLNERLGVGKKPMLNDYAARKDLKSLIDFNKQYIMTNELFKGDSQAFQAAITRINDTSTIEDALEYIKTDLMPRYQWSSDMQSARLFDKLVRQKFGLT